jgi:hypothetical protein
VAENLTAAKHNVEVASFQNPKANVRAVNLLSSDSTMLERGTPMCQILSLRLKDILVEMNLPESRRFDVAWLNRNLAFNNSKHPKFEEASNLIRRLLKLGIRDLSLDMNFNQDDVEF